MEDSPPAPDLTESTMRGRVGRYVRVGRSVGGAAMRLAGSRYLGVKLDRDRHAAGLREALGGLKGPLMKTAQILATIPDALPESYARELRELQANAPAMGWPFVRRRMESALGPDWRDRFGTFERTAARAASLGQVHRAQDKAGRRLACKLQYPDMVAAVDADIRQLKLILGLYRRRNPTIDTSQILAELAARLREELDYRREARHTAMYGAMLSGEAGVHVPEVWPALSADRLLTTTWLEGEPLADHAATASQEVRNRVARNMFRAWYVPFYFFGVIHGDPHLGNYTVRSHDHGINLFDFGCIRVFRPSFVAGVIDLYHALLHDDPDLAVHAYESWGFRDISREVVDILNIWARFLYAPVMTDRVQRIQESESGLYGAGVADRVHRELRRVGGVTPPREFVLMDRAAIGLGSVFLRLKAEINWYRLFQELVAGFDPDALADRQTGMLNRHDLPLP